MCDIFTQKDVHNVLQGKRFLFIGDSIMRNMYKDLVWLTTHPREEFLKTRFMQKKGEPHLGGLQSEKRIHISQLTAGRDYEEVREYYDQTWGMQYSFYFITRCWSDKLYRFLETYPQEYGSYPDVIMINSALWDINRWGTMGTRHFRYNIHTLLHNIKWLLRKRPDVQVIWMTTPPISTEIRGGFMVRQIEFAKLAMRFNIMEGNQYAANAAAAYGFDVLDMHYYMCHQIHRRAADGIHWNSEAVRMQVNVFVTHFCLSRGLQLQNRWKETPYGKMSENILLEEAKLAQRAAVLHFRERFVHRGIKPNRLQQRTFVHAHRRFGDGERARRRFDDGQGASRRFGEGFGRERCPW
jgi:hypothetical protein